MEIPRSVFEKVKEYEKYLNEFSRLRSELREYFEKELKMKMELCSVCTENEVPFCICTENADGCYEKPAFMFELTDVYIPVEQIDGEKMYVKAMVFGKSEGKAQK